MATAKALHACARPGCRNLIPKGAYCEQHRPRPNTEAPGYKPPTDDRLSAAERGYDSAWRKLRDEFLSNNPTCCQCGQPATVAHHIHPKRAGGPDSMDNLAALCRSCHERVEGRR